MKINYIEGELLGYKAFNKGLVDRYDKKYELNKKYQTNYAHFGHSGYHFCMNLEDTLRYVDGINEELDICEVKASGILNLYEDDYYGYYDMYSATEITILKILSRKEIIDMMLNTHEDRINRFVSGYKLTDEELALFENKQNNETHKYILYYQRKKNDAFK